MLPSFAPHPKARRENADDDEALIGEDHVGGVILADGEAVDALIPLAVIVTNSPDDDEEFAGALEVVLDVDNPGRIFFRRNIEFGIGLCDLGKIMPCDVM
jgi:hypothetical protein